MTDKERCSRLAILFFVFAFGALSPGVRAEQFGRPSSRWESTDGSSWSLEVLSEYSLIFGVADGGSTEWLYKTIKSFETRDLLTIWREADDGYLTRDIRFLMTEWIGEIGDEKLILWRCPDAVPWEYFALTDPALVWSQIEKNGGRVGRDFGSKRCQVSSDEPPAETGWVAEIWKPQLWRGLDGFPPSQEVDERIYGNWKGGHLFLSEIKFSRDGYIDTCDAYYREGTVGPQDCYRQEYEIVRSFGDLVLVIQMLQAEQGSDPYYTLSVYERPEIHTYFDESTLIMDVWECYPHMVKDDLFKDLVPENIWQRILDREKLAKSGSVDIQCLIANRKSPEDGGWASRYWERALPK